MSSQPIPKPSLSPRPSPAPERASCRIILHGGEFRLSPGIFTLDGFRAWATSEDSPDKAKVTFLDGQVTIDLSGEEIQASTLVKTAVCVPLGQIALDLGPGGAEAGSAVQVCHARQIPRLGATRGKRLPGLFRIIRVVHGRDRNT